MLDCDPGTDDALAIFLALGAPDKIDVKAILATYGNVDLGRTKANLLQILDFFKHPPPLGSGSKGPMKHSALEARGVHGEDGLGGLSGYTRGGGARRPVFKHGVDLIIDLALSDKIDTIIATGPLTDLAAAVKKASAILKKLDEVIIMGGAVFVRGNATPYAEFNFHCDPEAAKIILQAPVEKRLVSLDVTHKTVLSARRLEPLKAIKNPLAVFIRHIADYSIRSNKRRGLSGAPMHDPLAVALALDKGLGEYKRLRLDVETRGRRRGGVIVKRGKPNTLFCENVDVDKFFKLFIGTLVKLAKGDKDENKRIV
ncbi:MAG: nucleoside hydrolase [Candidatus Omnitrophica bacterium]|nr:nucleoside hydrolase [Candidatus Omnitrophota bacterium]